MNMHKISRFTRTLAILVLGFVLCIPLQADADGRFSARGFHGNAAGGLTHSRASGFRAPNAGSFRTRSMSTDGQGNVAAGSISSFRTPAGTIGGRGGVTTRTSDGTVNHQSGMAVSGSMGSVQSQGDFSKASDGTVSGSRNTNAQSQSGASYQGQTSYSTGSGLTHTGTCTDANGNPVTCPQR